MGTKIKTLRKFKTNQVPIKIYQSTTVAAASYLFIFDGGFPSFYMFMLTM